MLMCIICHKDWEDCECSSEGDVFTSYHEDAFSSTGDPEIIKSSQDLQQEEERLRALQLRQLKDFLGLAR